MRLKLPILAAPLAVVVAGTSYAASVSLYRSVRSVTPAEAAAGAPLGGYVSDFFVDTDSDILSFNQIGVTAPLYQHSLGRDDGPVNDAMLPMSAALSADSYITTPGPTVMLGGGFGDKNALWGDLTNGGPQHNFHFARLTASQPGEFSGNVTVRGYSDPVYVPFKFALPASAADADIANSQAPYTFSYSLDPPPRPPVTTPPYVPPVNPIGGAPPAPQPLPPAGNPPSPGNDPDSIRPGSLTLSSTLSIERESRLVTAQEVAGGAPLGAVVNEFRLTTDNDILSIANVNLDSAPYQNALGSESSHSPQALVEAMPAVGANSYIQMPGNTVVLGGGFGGGANALWGDLSDDGAQTNFLFSQLTLTQSGNFAGEIAVRNGDNFVSVPFSMALPGNAADLAALGATGRYSFTKQVVISAPVIPVVPTPPPFQGPQPPVVPDPPVQTPPVNVDPTIPPVADPPANPPQAPDQPQTNPDQPPINQEPPQTTPDQPQTTPDQPPLITNPPLIYVIDPVNILPGMVLPFDGSTLIDQIDLSRWHLVDYILSPGDSTTVVLQGEAVATDNGIRTLLLDGATTRLSDAVLFNSYYSTQGATEFSSHAPVPEPAPLALLIAAALASTLTPRRRP
jgi:hypothetical protein